MAEKYFNREDMQRKLNETICLWDGEPVYVSTGHGSAGDQVDIFRFSERGLGDSTRIDHTDPRFVDRSLPLGFLNRYQTCGYVSRVPYRRNIQPISSRQLQIEPDFGGGWFLSNEFANTIRGRYPSYADSLAWVTNGAYQGSAFCRDACIAVRQGIKQPGLYYKTRLIALWNIYSNRWDYLQGPEILHFKKLVEKLGVPN